MKYDITRTDHTVPVGNNRLIHVGHILEGSAAKPDDIGMVEVGVRCKEHPASVKFIIHNLLFFSAHHCAINTNFQYPWTEMTEKGA